MAAISLPRVAAPPYCSCQRHPRLPLLRHAASASPPMPLLPSLRISHTRHLLGFEMQRSSSHRLGQIVTAKASSCVQSSSTFSSAIVGAISRYVVAATVLVKALLRTNAVSLLAPLGQDEAKALAALKEGLRHAALPLCFAAISQSPPVSTPLTVVAAGMAKWLELYSGVLMIRVLLSWFPNIPWDRQPLQAIRDMCDPYLNLFRNLIPPIFNALDVSPMLAFLVLGFLASVLNSTMQG